MANIPDNLKYAKTHEWVRIDGDVATIGISDFAQKELGDVVYVDLPEVGRVLAKDETLGSVESVKTVSDLYAPVGGEVVEVNQALGSQSELINNDPYGKGYILKIRMADASQADSLLTPTDYAEVAA
jgi:glycine cleavage system H protein